VVTASEDNTARLWDPNTGKLLAVLRGHDHWLYAAAFSPDGNRIVTVSDDFTARLWDANTGEELVALHGHESVVVSAAFSPDGTKVVTSSWDKTARIWDVPRSDQKLIDLARQHVHRSLTSDERRRFFLLADETAKVGS
jgi:WD40 repeat protein